MNELSTKRRKMRLSKRTGKFFPYILILPTFVIITLFIYFPALYSFYLSFFKVSPFGNRKVFVGMQNFIEMFTDERFIKSVSFTLIFTGTTVLTSVLVSFLVAILLNQKVPGVRFFRTLIFAPYAVSTAVAGALWGFLLNPVVGYVNYVMASVFGVQVNWLVTIPYAAFAVIIASIWKTLPFDIIFYLAGLQGVSDELIEASRLDGANTWSIMWKILFPLLSPTTYYLIIMNIMSSTFESFAIIDVMTRGGPGEYTTNLIYKIYLDGFRFSKTGPASAQTVVLFIVMSIVTLIYFRVGRREVYYQ